jgi:hypothetical protein
MSTRCSDGVRYIYVVGVALECKTCFSIVVRGPKKLVFLPLSPVADVCDRATLDRHTLAVCCLPSFVALHNVVPEALVVEQVALKHLHKSGVAWRGVARRGVAWRGVAWRGARRGAAWRAARRGVARRSVALRAQRGTAVAW